MFPMKYHQHAFQCARNTTTEQSLIIITEEVITSDSMFSSIERIIFFSLANRTSRRIRTSLVTLSSFKSCDPSSSSVSVPDSVPEKNSSPCSSQSKGKLTSKSMINQFFK